MLNMKYLILFLSCTALVCLGDITPQLSNTTTPTPAPSTTPAPPNTTTVAPTTSTVAPQPNTTTVAPQPNTTTVAPQPNTTTVAPTTSTVAPSTSTVAPTPKPSEPTVGTWVVNKTGEVCIVAQMALQVKVTYTNLNKTIDDLINLPSANETTVEGSCDNNGTQILMIKWNNNSLAFVFAQNETEKEFMLDKLNLTVQVQDKLMEATLDKPKFITPLSMSYKCDREETLKLVTSPNGNDTIVVNVQHLQLQAFRTDNKTVNFSTAQDCRVPTQDIVPIAVGCALAGLVLIVLVAYLVGRRRVSARGYLSIRK